MSGHPRCGSRGISRDLPTLQGRRSLSGRLDDLGTFLGNVFLDPGRASIFLHPWLRAEDRPKQALWIFLRSFGSFKGVHKT